MIVFTIASLIFVGVVTWVLLQQRKNQAKMQATTEQFNATLNNVVPLVQKQHVIRYGRASTALETSFPPVPKNKSHPA